MINSSLKYLYVAVLFISLILFMLGNFLVDENAYIAKERAGNKLILKHHVDILKHMNTEPKPKLIVSEWMPFVGVYELKNKFMVTLNKHGNYYPPTYYFDWSVCDFEDTKSRPTIKELLECDPNLLVYAKRSSYDRMIRQNPEIKFDLIDSTRINYLFKVKRVSI